MGKVFADISTSLDGFVAGPNPSLDEPLGESGEQLHEWVFGLKSWREPHGRPGGATGPDNEIVEETLRRTGATVMGRRMYSGGEGAWDDDPRADGWWGDPPFHHPVFVLTHHPRAPLTKQGGTTFKFVTDGVESAVEQARSAAADKDVHVAGGAEAIQQCMKAGLLDEIQIHVAPMLLGGGVRLFENLGAQEIELEPTTATASPAVTHLSYRVG